MQMQQQQFQILLEVIKNQKGKEEKENGIMPKIIEKILNKPEMLITISGPLFKFLKNTFSKKDELIELIRLAKDDAELKEVALELVSAKYGGSGNFLDKLLSNPEILSRTLEIVNKVLKSKNLPPISESENINPNPSNTETEIEMEEKGVGNILEIANNILEAFEEQKKSPEEVYQLLKPSEKEGLKILCMEYGVENAKELLELIASIPAPKFLLQGYLEGIKKHKEKVNLLLKLLLGKKEE